MSKGKGTPFGLSRIEPDPSLDWVPEALLAVRDALQLGTDDIVDWLILRPLALGKVLELPPIPARAMRALATANVERFFPVRAAEWVGDARPLYRSRSRPRPALVTALPKQALAIVEAATRGADLRLGRIVPAPAATALHARRLIASDGCPEDCDVECHLPGYTEVVRLRCGVPTGLIPLPGDCEPAVDHPSGGDTPGCSIVNREWPLALELAATAAHERVIPQPLTASQWAVRRRVARQRSGIIAVAASIAVLVGLGLQIIDQRRELNSLRGVRETLATDVERALSQRTLLQGLETSLRELASAEASQPNWPGLFGDLAAALPASAHVTRLAGRPDSLTLTLATDDLAVLEVIRSRSAFKVQTQRAAQDGTVQLLASWRSDETAGATGAD